MTRVLYVKVLGQGLVQYGIIKYRLHDICKLCVLYKYIGDVLAG